MKELSEMTNAELLREREEAWIAFDRNGGRGVEEAEWIDELDAEIKRRGQQESMSNEYLVDVPNPHAPTEEWVNVAGFETIDQALAYVRETFGADERGRIGLVSVLNADGDNEARALGASDRGTVNEVPREWLVALAENYESERDYFEREGEPDTAADFNKRAEEVRALIAEQNEK